MLSLRPILVLLNETPLQVGSFFLSKLLSKGKGQV